MAPSPRTIAYNRSLSEQCCTGARLLGLVRASLSKRCRNSNDVAKYFDLVTMAAARSNSVGPITSNRALLSLYAPPSITELNHVFQMLVAAARCGDRALCYEQVTSNKAQITKVGKAIQDFLNDVVPPYKLAHGERPKAPSGKRGKKPTQKYFVIADPETAVLQGWTLWLCVNQTFREDQGFLREIVTSCFGCDREAANDHVVEIPLTTYGELETAIEKAHAKLNRHSRSADGDFVLALHVADSKSDRAREIVMEISKEGFDRYPYRDDDHRILISGSLHKLLVNHFSSEPVGELRDPNSTTGTRNKKKLHEAVHRIWYAYPQSRSSEWIDDEVIRLAHVRSRSTQTWYTGANAEQTAQDVAQGLVRRFESQLGPKGVVLHWQCTAERRHDLLRPFDESIAGLIGLYRRSEFQGKGDSTTNVSFIASRMVKSLLNREVGEQKRKRLAKAITSILTGSKNESSFARIETAIKELLVGLSNGPLRIVVENSHLADELLERLTNSLEGYIPGHADFQLHAIGVSDDATTDASRIVAGGSLSSRVHASRPASLSDSAKAILKIAAILGSDFPRKWLRACWERLPVGQGRAGADFAPQLAECLRGGYLQFCDSLIDGPNRDYFRRQLKWVRRADQAAFAGECVQADRMALQDAFWLSLAAGNSKEGEPALKPPEITELRLRSRIFDLLALTGKYERIDPVYVARLGRFLGRRADLARAPNEAIRRYSLAIGAICDGAKLDDQAIRELGVALIQGYLQHADFRQPADSVELQKSLGFAEAVLESVTRVEMRTRSGDFFDLFHQIWSRATWIGDLKSAEQRAVKMVWLADEDVPLQFDAYHALCVTYLKTGELDKCLAAAANGNQCAEKLKSISYKGRPSTSSHDCRICCRACVGLADLLRTGSDREAALDECIVFARSGGDKNAIGLAYSYRALGRLLEMRFDEALQDCASCPPMKGPVQWSLLTELLADCAKIGQAFSKYDGRTFSTNSHLQLQQHREQWGVREYETLWQTFEAIARFVDGSPLDSVLKSLEDSIDPGRRRNELAFLPYVRIWQGDLAAAAQDKRAEELWFDARNIALEREMADGLYISLIDKRTNPKDRIRRTKKRKPRAGR
jgi:hypothetical protein